MKRLLKNKEGFTLVELIVVLIVLAILAAILVPTLLGYIEKARQESAIEECHSCVVAAQSAATDEYGNTGVFIASANTAQISTIKTLTGTTGTVNEVTYLTGSTLVSKLVYITAKGVKVTYTYAKGDAEGKYTFGNETATEKYPYTPLDPQTPASNEAIRTNLRSISGRIEEILKDNWEDKYINTSNKAWIDLTRNGRTDFQLTNKNGSTDTFQIGSLVSDVETKFGDVSQLSIRFINDGLEISIKGGCNNTIIGFNTKVSSRTTIVFNVRNNTIEKIPGLTKFQD
jgi:prepilin-type N-terminal cleavage/methylation domain-containing protein